MKPNLILVRLSILLWPIFIGSAQLHSQTKPKTGNILVVQEAGIIEVDSDDFSIVQQFAWPAKDKLVSEKTVFSAIAYHNRKTIYVLANERLDETNGPRFISNIFPLDVETGKWQQAIQLPDMEQEYDKMQLVNNQLIASGYDRNVQFDLGAKKAYRLQTGYLTTTIDETGKGYVYISNYEADRESPLRKVSLADGSIVKRFKKKQTSGFHDSGKGVTLTNSGIRLNDFSREDSNYVKIKWDRKRGMNKRFKEGVKIYCDGSIDRLDTSRLVYSRRNDRRLFTIANDLDTEKIESHEFEYNTGCLTVAN